MNTEFLAPDGRERLSLADAEVVDDNLQRRV